LIDVPVIYEDARLIALGKPSGLLVIPGRGAGEDPALNLLLEQRLGARIFVVHRIDREASGVVLFAKDAEAHRLLCASFAARAARKKYLALVQGLAPEQGSVDSPIRAFGSGRMGADPGGKPSLTRWRRLAALRGASLLEVEPETGRRHQIRAHLYSIGHPILGDPLYGNDRPVGKFPRLMLHSLELSLAHPDGSLLRLRAPEPADFLRALEDVQ
jgi:RluA family pseudouridine synthase